jgi:crossover junction endodeoxyribonuclease RuvC
MQTSAAASVRVLGIDPGYDRLGLAVIEKTNGKDTLLFSACFETPKTNAHAKRLQGVGDELSRVIREFHPTNAALETLFFSKNQKTALKVAEARGVILATLAHHNLTIHELSPADVKIGVTGYGRADKQQVIAMIPRIISLPQCKRHDDEYDAIAIALTCLAMCANTSYPHKQQ